ncbi:endonuclease/exonuclease/phosphatase family protein [Cystobacter ferrugineus]|nr:endonuclease/exonuclease/phosphatase family protein [Cystobacter ferrugineus]
MLKVLTLNIAHGVPSLPMPLPFLLPRRWLLEQLERVAGLLARERADVVALQEVDRAGLFSGAVDPLERLATRAGYPHLLHGPHLHLPGVCARGTALLSLRPLHEPEWNSFEADRAVDKGYVVAAVEDEGRLLDVVSVHLDSFSERCRQRQVARLLQALERRPPRPRLVLGDLNSPGDSPAGSLSRLVEALALHAPSLGGEPTWPARRPARRLDWILAPGALRFREQRTLAERVSDHLAVTAELEWVSP